MLKQQDYTRYQFQPWYVKLYRRRWYLTIPLVAIKMWLRNKNTSKDKNLSLQTCWSISTGLAHCRMNWLYHWEERFPENEESGLQN